MYPRFFLGVYIRLTVLQVLDHPVFEPVCSLRVLYQLSQSPDTGQQPDGTTFERRLAKTSKKTLGRLIWCSNMEQLRMRGYGKEAALGDCGDGDMSTALQMNR